MSQTKGSSLTRTRLSTRDPATVVIDSATSNSNGVEMYNNTVVAGTSRVTAELDENLGQVGASLLYGSFVFENDIVDATSPDAASHFFGCGSSCTNNLFFGMPVPPARRARSRPTAAALPAEFPPPAAYYFFWMPVNDPLDTIVDRVPIRVSGTE